MVFQVDQISQGIDQMGADYASAEVAQRFLHLHPVAVTKNQLHQYPLCLEPGGADLSLVRIGECRAGINDG